jgi:hypothetical protein
MTANAAPRSFGTGAKFALIVLGIILLLPGACGMAFFTGMFVEWLSDGFRFASGDLNLGPAVVIISSASLIGSILLLTILIFATRWPTGRKLCLPLAIIAAIVVVVGYAMMIGTIDDSNSEELFMLHLACVGGLVFGFLPPFLVWRRSRLTTEAGAPQA